MPLSPLSYSELTKRLKRFGFRFYRQGKGSHELWVRDEDGKVVPVPKTKKDIKKGTVRAIIRQIGVDFEEFIK